jgi:hypothetical protein
MEAGPFLRRLIDAQWDTSRPHHHIRISALLCQDLKWWRDFLPIFNEQTELIPSRPFSLTIFRLMRQLRMVTTPSYMAVISP